MLAPSVFILWGVAIALGAMAYWHPQRKLREGLHAARNVLIANIPRVAMALLSAGFLSEILPRGLVAEWLGEGSGMRGILIASLAGSVIPGGPIVSFPIAVVLSKSGVDVPQLVAFIAAWSVFALHRIFAYEMPLMGPRFSMMRLASSFMLPPLAGVSAALLVSLLEGKALLL